MKHLIVRQVIQICQKQVHQHCFCIHANFSTSDQVANEKYPFQPVETSVTDNLQRHKHYSTWIPSALNPILVITIDHNRKQTQARFNRYLTHEWTSSLVIKCTFTYFLSHPLQSHTNTKLCKGLVSVANKLKPIQI